MSTTDERGRPDVEFSFPHDLQAPRRARHELQMLLYSHDSSAASVILAVSELVSNVVQHTANGGSVKAWIHAPVRVEVADTSMVDDFSPTSAVARRGRGLQIVSEITEQWGVDVVDSGKVVWAEFATASRDGR